MSTSSRQRHSAVSPGDVADGLLPALYRARFTGDDIKKQWDQDMNQDENPRQLPTGNGLAKVPSRLLILIPVPSRPRQFTPPEVYGAVMTPL